MLKDLVTIVVPVYNSEEYIKDNIESVLRQTYTNLEIIYVCDGCTDNTVNILKQYVCDKRLIIKEEDNHGAAVSRNLGMEMAHGDWIIFLDADDIFAENMIFEILKAAKNENADMCCCSYECFASDICIRQKVDSSWKKMYCSTYPIVNTKSELRNIMQIVDKAPWNKLVHKSIYSKEQVYFQDVPNANDVYYSLSASIESNKMVFLEKALVYYRSPEGRHSLSTNRNKSRAYVLEAFDKVYNYISFKKDNTELLVSFYNAVIAEIFGYWDYPILDLLVEQFLNTYVNKWKMNDRQKMCSLFSKINRNIYFRIMENNLKETREDILVKERVEVVKKIAEKGCSIWGVGQLGSSLLGAISKAGITINNVYDTSEDMIGKKIGGYIVKAFDGYEKNMIITTPKYFDEISKAIRGKVENIYNLEKCIWENNRA